MTILAVIWAILSGLAINELSELSPWAARKVVCWSARVRYPDAARAEARSEELQALINERPGKLLKLITALYFAAAAIRAWTARALTSMAVDGIQVTVGGALALNMATTASLALATGLALYDSLTPPAQSTATSQLATVRVEPFGSGIKVTVTADRPPSAGHTYWLIDRFPTGTGGNYLYEAVGTIPAVKGTTSYYLPIVTTKVGSIRIFVIEADSQATPAMLQNYDAQQDAAWDSNRLRLPSGVLIASNGTALLRQTNGWSPCCRSIRWGRIRHG